MRTLVTIALLALLLPAAASAQRGARGQMRMQSQSRQTDLQRQVLRRFVEQSSREVGLSADERGRIEQILIQNNAQRHELAEEAGALRRKLMDAVRNPSTSDDEFAAILDDFTGLRQREHALWLQEQEQLANTLPPRKRAIFTLRWLRLQENIRTMIDNRPGGPPPDTGGHLPPDRRPPR